MTGIFRVVSAGSVYLSLRETGPVAASILWALKAGASVEVRVLPPVEQPKADVPRCPHCDEPEGAPHDPICAVLQVCP